MAASDVLEALLRGLDEKPEQDFTKPAFITRAYKPVNDTNVIVLGHYEQGLILGYRGVVDHE